MASAPSSTANQIPPSSASAGCRNQENEMDDQIQMDMVSIVSPYPFSHSSPQEIDEREQLDQAMTWPDEDESQQPLPLHKEISFQFDMKVLHNKDMECDDFSLSSNEQTSLEDLGESFSTDPETFWEAPVRVSQPSTPTEPDDNEIEKYPVPVIPTSTVLHLPELSC